ncbi:hypothetical protein A0J61_10990, partial [Choanephora cucurbitarum]
FTAFT